MTRLCINCFGQLSLNGCLGYTSKLDPEISQRGVALSSMFLRCVEHAAFANDICGQPLPPDFVNPWHYFDGKLFQQKLSQSQRPGANLLNICNEDRAILPVLDSLRAAILEGTQSTRATRQK